MRLVPGLEELAIGLATSLLCSLHAAPVGKRLIAPISKYDGGEFLQMQISFPDFFLPLLRSTIATKTVFMISFAKYLVLVSSRSNSNGCSSRSRSRSRRSSSSTAPTHVPIATSSSRSVSRRGRSSRSSSSSSSTTTTTTTTTTTWEKSSAVWDQD